jgi:hypothetical protein
VILDSVLNQNTMLRIQTNTLGVKGQLGIRRIYWTRNFGVQADTDMVIWSNFSTNADGTANSSALTTSKQFNYSVSYTLGTFGF